MPLPSIKAPAFNPLVGDLSAPPIPSVFAWGRAYQGGAGPLIDLSQAAPGYPPHPDMLAWLAEAAGSTAYSGYGPIEGEPALRQAYAEHMTSIYGAPFGPANVHVTAGANQGFMCVAMALAGHGDRIALPCPFYFNHDTTLAMLGIETVPVACDPEQGFLPDMASVKAALAAGVKALVIITPNNPTGAIYPADVLRELYRLCREAGTWLVLDETYRDFLIDASVKPHDLFDQPDWQSGLIQLYSFSKSFCIPGHRMATITAGPEVVAQVLKVMDNLQICPPRAPQAALAKAIPALGRWREANRLEILRRADALRMAFSSLPAWRLDSLGAYFAFARHPFGDLPSAAVAEALARQAGVLCVPGSYFGAGQDHYLRLAFANADVETIARLPERLSGFDPRNSA